MLHMDDSMKISRPKVAHQQNGIELSAPTIRTQDGSLLGNMHGKGFNS